MADKKKKIALIVSIIAGIIVSAGSIFLYLYSQDSIEISSSNAELSYTMVKYEILGKHISQKEPGSKILIITDKQRRNDSRSPLLLEAFKKGLEGKTSIVAMETPEIIWDERRPRLTPEEMDMIPIIEITKPEAFDKIIDMHPECNIVVSFIGLPYEQNKMRNGINFIILVGTICKNI